MPVLLVASEARHEVSVNVPAAMVLAQGIYKVTSTYRVPDHCGGAHSASLKFSDTSCPAILATAYLFCVNCCWNIKVRIK